MHACFAHAHAHLSDSDSKAYYVLSRVSIYTEHKPRGMNTNNRERQCARKNVYFRNVCCDFEAHNLFDGFELFEPTMVGRRSIDVKHIYMYLHRAYPVCLVWCIFSYCMQPNQHCNLISNRRSVVYVAYLVEYLCL